MMKKLITAAAATALLATSATASVRPMAAVPMTSSTATAAVQVHDDDGHNEIYWVIGVGAIIGIILFVLAFDGDDDDEELPVSLA